MKNSKKVLTDAQIDALISALKLRFEKNQSRHVGIIWDDVAQKLNSSPDKIQILNAMEDSGGEPDVIGYDKKSKEYIFCDCSPESPAGRRSICYDQAALDKRKENKPKNSAMALAEEMGIKILSEAEYRDLQQFGKFDLKTSSWIETPEPIRKLGGALFCDRRYDSVFTYHNGADSYYAARGFRGTLRV